MKSYNQIINYISRIRNLYFLRSILQGLLYLLIFVFTSFFIFILSDIAIHFSSGLLQIIHFSLYFIVIALVLFYIGTPLYYWFYDKSKYSYYWFAKQIGNADSSVDDKLLNILELKNSNRNNSLVNASIEQKISNVNVSQIETFFTFRTLLKQIYIFLGLIVLISLLALLNPQSFSYSTQRILPYSSTQKELPYSIQLSNTNLNVDKGRDLYIKAEVIGIHRPERLYIDIGGEHYFMNDSSNFFTYKLSNVKQSLSFRLVNDVYTSDLFHVNCIPVPILKQLKLNIKPPDYTYVDEFVVNGTGNVTFPYGSVLTWNISTIDTDSMYLLSDSMYSFSMSSSDNFSYQKRFFSNFNYHLILKNNNRDKLDSVIFSANIIPDQYPGIKLQTSRIDLLGTFNFVGEISDDYGFYSFDFIIKNKDKEFVVNIPLISSSVSQQFNYSGTLSDYKSKIGNDDVELLLRITDNDPFYPHKQSYSQSLYGKLPNQNELSSLEQSKVTSLKDKLSLGTQLLNQLNKEKQDIRKKLLSENMSNWEKQQLSDQIEQTNNDLNQLSEEINKLRKELKEFSKFDKQSELLDKKQQLEELLEKMMDEELKELMEELKKLQNEISNNETPKLDNVELSMEELEKHLDQNLEMLKRYEVEKKQEEIINELRELSKEFNDSTSNTTQKELDSLKNELDNAFKEHQENIENNKDLQDPYNLKDFDKEKEEIKQQSDQLDNPEDLKDSKKNPGDEIKDLANQMQMNMQSAMQEQEAEDAAMIRELLENLLLFSFMQEKYIDQFNSLERYNLNELKRKQVNLKERFKSLNDSLTALASRNSSVAVTLGNQIKNIHFNFNEIQNVFQEERFKSIQVNQQDIMQSINELILLLNESLDQMDSNSGMGGSCKKQSKKSKPGMSGMKKKQQSMKKSLQQMIDQLKKGSQSGKGQKKMSEQLSKMLGEQEKLQQMLQQMMQSGDVGQTTKQMLQEINKMVDRNIDDIIHRNINDNLIRRQNQIMNRMLEAEKAEEEREKDKKRESEQPNNYKISNPEEIFQYKEEHKLQKGIIDKEKLPLKYFYQRKYDKYLNDVEND
jgi:hypothetical protein